MAYNGAMNAHTITHRLMAGEADFWRMRDLLVASVENTPLGLTWDIRRLEGKRFYNADPAADDLLVRPVALWEDAGELVGFVVAESACDAHLQVHGDYRHLEEEMIAWAEENLAAAVPGTSQRQVEIYVYDVDVLRQRLLAGRGYVKMDMWGMLRRIRLGKGPLAQPQAPPGYTLRTTRPRDLAECARMADLLNAAFGRTFHNAQEYHNFAMHAPCFRPELDLVAEALDGSLAAYIGIPYDAVNRRGIFEPVCTHPDHRRRGLAQALMQEGLLRLRELGAVDATVDTGDMTPANRFYDSMGFTEAYRGVAWRKVW